MRRRRKLSHEEEIQKAELAIALIKQDIENTTSAEEIERLSVMANEWRTKYNDLVDHKVVKDDVYNHNPHTGYGTKGMDTGWNKLPLK